MESERRNGVIVYGTMVTPSSCSPGGGRPFSPPTYTSLSSPMADTSRTPKRLEISSFEVPGMFTSFSSPNPPIYPWMADYGKGTLEVSSPMTPGGEGSSPCSQPLSAQKGTGIRRGRPRLESITNLISEGTSSPSAIRCHVCKRVFPREKSLQAHMRTHTGERPYVCNFSGCSKAFAQSGQLRTHQRLHTGEKPFKCTAMGCTNRFTHANRHCSLHPHAGLRRDKLSTTPNVLREQNTLNKETSTPNTQAQLLTVYAPLGKRGPEKMRVRKLKHEFDAENDSGLGSPPVCKKKRAAIQFNFKKESTLDGHNSLDVEQREEKASGSQEETEMSVRFENQENQDILGALALMELAASSSGVGQQLIMIENYNPEYDLLCYDVPGNEVELPKERSNSTQEEQPSQEQPPSDTPDNCHIVSL